MLKKISNKRNILALAATLLIVSMMAISCSAQGVAEPEDTIDIFFGDLVAKDVVYDQTAYDEESSADAWSSSVTAKDPNSLYWAYAATKADQLYKQGDTTVEKDEVDNKALFTLGGVYYKAVKAEAGLDAKLSGFSRGEWLFELRGYETSDDRKKDTNVVYKGKYQTEDLTQSSKVSIPVTFAYADNGSGDRKMGYVSFDITVNYKQAEGASIDDTAIGEYDLAVYAVIGKDANGADTADRIPLTYTKTDVGEAVAIEGDQSGQKYFQKTYHFTNTVNTTTRMQEIAQDGELHLLLTKPDPENDGGVIEEELDLDSKTDGVNGYTGNTAVIMSGLDTHIKATINVTLKEGGLIDVQFETPTTVESLGQPTADFVDGGKKVTGYVEGVNDGTATGAGATVLSD